MSTAPLKCTEVATGDALAKQIADIIDVEVKDSAATAKATSDEDTANNIDQLFQKTLAAKPGDAEDFLYTLWDVVLKAVVTIPATDERLHNLIAVIEALKRKDTAKIEIWGEKTTVWKDLPMLGPALREAWNCKLTPMSQKIIPERETILKPAQSSLNSKTRRRKRTRRSSRSGSRSTRLPRASSAARSSHPSTSRCGSSAPASRRSTRPRRRAICT